ncbi:MAG TPA: FAD-dependent oxidoreductase [Kofleriaceae bacterium]|nr:FAD-dependent oxidoreductase [Kofleriaceae bacterium]
MIADAVVVGAGVIGASCAYHLARAGLRVTVVDRAAGPGGGSTARATGGFRAQFATAVNVQLSLIARARLAAFRDETGVDPGFDPVGYLWLATGQAELAALRDAHAVQRAAGLRDARLLDRDEALACNPAVAGDRVIGGAWCPSDGVIRPMAILRGYLDAAARLGAVVRWDEPVVALERAGDRIAAVVTPRGRHAAGLVIDCAGAWAASVARLAGVELPVVPLRRQVAITEPTTALPARSPLTIWQGDGFHLRVRDDRVLLLRPSPGDPGDPWSVQVEPAWLDDVAARAARRVPALGRVALDRAGSWAGLYEMSPDGHAIVGAAPGCANLWFASGSSGHGVMHAPALGLVIAELARDATPPLDLHPLRPGRFADATALAGPALL